MNGYHHHVYVRRALSWVPSIDNRVHVIFFSFSCFISRVLNTQKLCFKLKYSYLSFNVWKNFWVCCFHIIFFFVVVLLLRLLFLLYPTLSFFFAPFAIRKLLFHLIALWGGVHPSKNFNQRQPNFCWFQVVRLFQRNQSHRRRRRRRLEGMFISPSAHSMKTWAQM